MSVDELAMTEDIWVRAAAIFEQVLGRTQFQLLVTRVNFTVPVKKELVWMTCVVLIQFRTLARTGAARALDDKTSEGIENHNDADNSLLESQTGILVGLGSLDSTSSCPHHL